MDWWPMGVLFGSGYVMGALSVSVALRLYTNRLLHTLDFLVHPPGEDPHR
jgi:hypothetical protein